MELLKLSKFKLQLRALISELQQLKELERSATKQCNQLNQKQKQTEEEFGRKLQELQTELASSLDSQSKLETKVKYLENDNFLLENKQKELKGTIESLLQSRETFMSFYQDSTCEMKRSIEIRDRKLVFLSEKIKAHFLLFDSIEKEAISVKQVVDNVQQTVSDKEGVVAGLMRKMDQISAFEKDFINKIQFLENKLRYTQDELRKKDAHISELQGQLEAAKISYHPEVEELQKSLSMKDEVIQNITAEKKALRCEVRGLEIALRKIQEAVMSMEAEDQILISSALEDQGECVESSEKQNDRSDAADPNCREVHIHIDQGAADNKGPSLCLDNPVNEPSNEQQNMDSCISEGNSTLLVQPHQLDSECSTTEVEPPEEGSSGLSNEELYAHVQDLLLWKQQMEARFGGGSTMPQFDQSSWYEAL